MRRKLKKLEAVNFGSWQHLNFDFQNQGNVLIIGKIGAGKSGIFKALTWGLYGKLPVASHVPVQVDEIVNEVHGKNAMVKVSLQVNDDEYEITRYRKHQQWKNKVVIHKNGKRFGEKDSKVGMMDKIIEEIIGLDYESWIKIEFFIQRDTQRFPSLTDTQQKKLVESLTELKILPLAEKLASQYTQQHKIQYITLKEREQQQIESLKTAHKLKKSQKEEVEKKESVIKASIKEARNHLEEAKADLATFQKEYEEKSKEDKKLNKELLETEAMLSVLKDELKKVRSKMDKTQLLSTGSKCERCGSILTTESIQEIYGNLKIEEEKLEKQRDDQKEKMEKLEKEVKDANFNKLEKGIKDSGERIEKWRSYVKARKQELEGVKPETQHVEQIEYSLQSQLFKTRWMKKYTKRIKYLIGLWKIGFGRKGMRIMYLPKILKALEAKTNKYLQAFDPQNINVQYSIVEGRIAQRYLSTVKKPRSYATLSGGEAQMVDISTSLALRELAEESRASMIDFIILDEPFDGLDDDLIQKVPQVLEMIQKNSIFVISHNKNLRLYFKKIVHVKKQNSTSTIV